MAGFRQAAPRVETQVSTTATARSPVGQFVTPGLANSCHAAQTIEQDCHHGLSHIFSYKAAACA
jgi:hypothetical protein